MSETERNLKVAKECGAEEITDVVERDEHTGERLPTRPFYMFDIQQLNAYTARILAERDAAHAEAISKLQEENEIAKRFSSDAIADLARAKQKLSSANAAIAMKDEALSDILSYCAGREDAENIGVKSVRCIAQDAVSTSSESLAAWEAEKLEPLRKQVAMLRVLRAAAAKKGEVK